MRGTIISGHNSVAHYAQSVVSIHRNYALEVAQNPIRARMCGFGDKVNIIHILFPGSPIDLPFVSRTADRSLLLLSPSSLLQTKMIVSSLPSTRFLGPISGYLIYTCFLITNPSSIQVAFFIVLVDLWDEFGQHEMNHVPNAAPHGATSRRYRVQRSESQPLSQRHKGSVRPSPALS